ncbi:MAG TPA: hypothetical protein VK475_00900 [Pyrinomonadaceae bacterium]|nr:hypothetical protein [Pyrinomonadaceae bacterium]
MTVAGSTGYDRRRAKATSPLKRGLLDKWIIEILNDLGEQGDLQGMNISVESIKANLRRGKKKQGAKVAPKG